MSVNIIVPIYRTGLTEMEIISLRRCLEVFGGRRKITVVKPESLDLGPLDSILSGTETASFDDGFFQDIIGYNRLMMSPDFYGRFTDNEFIFIYQTDCYVFRDELDEWCAKGYDYVGAPWIPKKKYSLPLYRFYIGLQKALSRLLRKPCHFDILGKVGNGGLSLRRTSLLKRIAEEKKDMVGKYLKRCERDSRYNEDVFWCIDVPESGCPLGIPDFEEALDFSFDVRPEIGFKLTGGRLPMGCHGWSKKKNIGFWKEHIPMDP